MKILAPKLKKYDHQTFYSVKHSDINHSNHLSHHQILKISWIADRSILEPLGVDQDYTYINSYIRWINPAFVDEKLQIDSTYGFHNRCAFHVFQRFSIDGVKDIAFLHNTCIFVNSSGKVSNLTIPKAVFSSKDALFANGVSKNLNLRHKMIPRSFYRFKTPYTVTAADINVGNHLSMEHVLRIGWDARFVLLSRLGVYSTVVVVSAKINWISEAKRNEKLIIWSDFRKRGPKSFFVDQMVISEKTSKPVFILELVLVSCKPGLRSQIIPRNLSSVLMPPKL